MSYAQELAALIAIRNFLMTADENAQFKLSQTDSRALRSKVSEIDQAIVARALKFDPSEAKVITKTFKSSVDVDQIMKAVDGIASSTNDNTDENGEEQPVAQAAKPKHKIVKHG